MTEDLRTLKFNYGFTTKTVHGKEYSYFWKCEGTGRKTEVYLGRADALKTQKNALLTELTYLQGLDRELTQRILKINQKLEALPATDEKKARGRK